MGKTKQSSKEVWDEIVDLPTVGYKSISKNLHEKLLM